MFMFTPFFSLIVIEMVIVILLVWLLPEYPITTTLALLSALFAFVACFLLAKPEAKPEAVRLMTLKAVSELLQPQEKSTDTPAPETARKLL